jgi:hypothetical protein
MKKSFTTLASGVKIIKLSFFVSDAAEKKARVFEQKRS